MTIIYLHIGFGRTGSTAIQKFGIDNQHLLRKSKTLYYPRDAHNASIHAKGNHDIEEIISNDKAKRELSQFEGDSVIFSSEGMMLFDDEKIRAIYEYFRGNDVKVVAYIRRQDDYLHSWHNQAVKWRENCMVSCEELADQLFCVEPANLATLFNIENNRNRIQDIRSQLDLDYFHILEKWSRLFTAENIVVKVFDRAQLLNNDIVVDFFSLVGICVEAGQHKQNKSLTDDYLSIALKLNRSLCEVGWPSKDKEQLSQIIWSLNDSYPCSTKETSNYLGNRYRRKILDYYRESNESIGQKYFGIGRRSPFSDVLPDSTKELKLPDSSKTYEILVEIIEGLMIGKRKELEEIKRNYEESSSWKSTRVLRAIGRAIRGIVVK